MADQTYEYVGVKPNEESPNGTCALELPKDYKISPMPMTDTKSYVIYSSLVSVEFMISTLSLIFYVALKASPVLIILSAVGLAALALGCLLSYQAVSTGNQRRQTFALVVFVIATMVCSATSIVALTMATGGSIQYTTSTTSNARTLYQNGYPYNSYYYDPYNSYPDYSNPYGSYNNNPYDGGYNPYDGGYNPYDGGYPYGGYGGYPYGGYNPYGGNPYNNYGNCPYSYGYPSTFTVHSSYFVAYTSGNIKYTYTYNYGSSSGPLGSQYSSYSYSHNLDCTTGHDDYTSASNSWSSTSYTNPYGGTYNYYNPYTGAIYSYASYNSPEPMSFEEGPGLILNGGNRFDDKMFTIVLFALKSLVFVGLIAQGISLRKSLTAKKRTQPLQQPQKIDMSGEVRKI